MGKLKKLKTLEMICIKDLETLPESIGDCRDLQSLEIKICGKLREIPNTIGKNENLKVLQLVNCKDLQQLPSEFIGKFSSIETINLSAGTSLKDLPITLSSHTLRTLDLSDTKVTSLPEWVTFIGTLECINLSNCSELVELPRGIGNLKRLEVLDISYSRKLRLPSEIGQLTRLRRLGLFVVGCGEDDARISDFGNLDMISGAMEFRDLQYVENPGDAEKAYLKQKRNIQSLTLRWSESGIIEQDQAMLDALEPPSEITNLQIDGYGGSHIPCWMRKRSDSSYLEGVVQKQTRAPEFLCLTLLKLKNLPNLKHMRGILVLPSLKSLFLKNMPNLEELRTTSGLGIEEEEVGGERCCFPVLSHLEATCCPKFTLTPCFPPLLVSLDLRSSNTQLLSPDSSFFRRHPNYADDEPSSSSRVIASAPQLKRLELMSMRGSSPGWEFLQHLAGLVALCIWWCDLTELPESMRGLTALQTLQIFRCPALGVLPEWFGELRSLKYLTVNSSRMMSSLPQSIEHLTSLEILEIAGWVNLKQLPEAIQHLTSLQELDLSECRSGSDNSLRFGRF